MDSRTPSVFALVVALVAAYGCGSNESATAAASRGTENTGNTNQADTPRNAGNANVTGTIQGHALAPASAVFAKVAYGSTASSLVVTLSSEAGFCEDQNNKVQRQNQTSLALVMISLDANGKTVTPQQGNYPITISQAIVLPSNRGASVFYALDANCSSALATMHASARVGSVTLDAVSEQSVAGRFVYQNGNDAMQGSFSAVPCPALAAEMEAGTKLTCVAR